MNERLDGRMVLRLARNHLRDVPRTSLPWFDCTPSCVHRPVSGGLLGGLSTAVETRLHRSGCVSGRHCQILSNFRSLESTMRESQCALNASGLTVALMLHARQGSSAGVRPENLADTMRARRSAFSSTKESPPAQEPGSVRTRLATATILQSCVDPRTKRIAHRDAKILAGDRGEYRLVQRPPNLAPDANHRPPRTSRWVDSSAQRTKSL